MTKERLEQIRKKFERHGQYAEKIMNGDAEYDGADGARVVLDLWIAAEELIADMEPHCASLPPVAGRESP